MRESRSRVEYRVKGERPAHKGKFTERKLYYRDWESQIKKKYLLRNNIKLVCKTLT